MSESAKSGRRSEKEIFFEALEKNSAAERSAFLDGACGNEPLLRGKVEALLADHFQQDAFMKEPAQVGERHTLELDLTPEAAPAQMIGRYKLLEKLGEGGFGEVWMAEQREPVKRRVALKIIKLGMDSRQVVARFEAERQALAMMDHASIARIFDAGVTDNGRPYFVMELVRGIKITEYCDQNQLPTRERLKLFILVCQAIQHAHQKGIIHRDIKPSNILVTLHDGVPVAKVIDFGIAKATQQELTDKTLFTQFQQFIGTPAYISPEQAEMSGLDIDTRADIYSLGVLLYELLVGQTPFDAKEMMQGGLDALRQIIREKEPQRPSTKLNTLPGEARTTAGKRRRTEAAKLVHQLQGDLDWIVMKCLEKDRTRRYDTANGLAMDILRHLANEPVVARPPSTMYRFQKAFRRQKLAFTAVFAVASAVIVGAVVSSIQWARARSESRAARVAEEHAQRNEARALDLVRELRLHSYATDMKIASLALEDQNRGLAQELIQKYLPKPGEDDLRGLEWRYLWMRSRGGEVATLHGHEGGVRDVVFSPDGKLLASVGLDRTVRIWEILSRKEIAKLPGPLDEMLHQSIAFAPNGSTFAVTRQGRIMLWNTADWQALPRELEGAQAPIIFSPDGKILAARAQGEVKLWDTTTWKTTILPTDSSQGGRGCLAISPDSSLLALSFAWNSPMQIWNLRTRLRVSEFMIGTGSIAFSPKGNRLAIGEWEPGRVLLLDVDKGKFIATNSAHTTMVFGIAFSPDEKLLVTAGGEFIHLHDAATLEKLATLKGHLNAVHSLACSKAEHLVASASMDGTIKLWRVDPGAQIDRQRDSSEIELLPLRQTRTELSSWTTNGLLQFWNVAGGRLTPRFALPVDRDDPSRFSDQVQLSLGGSHAAYGTTNGLVEVYDCASGEITTSLPAGHGRVRVGAFSPNNKRLLVSRESDGSGSLWNLETRQLEAVLPESDAYSSSLVGFPLGTFSPDGRLLAYVAQDYTVNLWDAVTKDVRCTLKGHTWLICSLKFSPDGRLLATSSFDGTTRVWEAATGKPSGPPLKGRAQTRAAWFTGDCRTLVAASDDHPPVRFWHLATGQETLAIKDAHAVLLSADDATLVLGRSNSTSVVRIPTLAEIDAAEKTAKLALPAVSQESRTRKSAAAEANEKSEIRKP